MTAPSRAISIVYESCGLTSRSRHCRGACPGILVVPSDPLVNDPFSLNSAGGSSQFFTSVIYVHVNAGVAVVSTECSVAHAMSLMFMPYLRIPQNTDIKARLGVCASIRSMTYNRALRSIEIQRARHNKLFICSKRCCLPYSMIRILKRPLVNLQSSLAAGRELAPDLSSRWSFGYSSGQLPVCPSLRGSVNTCVYRY